MFQFVAVGQGDPVFLSVPIHKPRDLGCFQSADRNRRVEPFYYALQADEHFPTGSIQVVRHQDTFFGSQQNFGKHFIPIYKTRDVVENGQCGS